MLHKASSGKRIEKAKGIIEKLPATRVHLTPGGGFYLIYRTTKPCSTILKFKQAFGIEVRGIGSVILLPPSVDGRYKVEDENVPVAKVDDFESLVYKIITSSPSWKEKEAIVKVLNLPQQILPCEVFFADHPFQSGLRELIVGKNVAIHLNWRKDQS